MDGIYQMKGRPVMGLQICLSILRYRLGLHELTQIQIETPDGELLNYIRAIPHMQTSAGVSLLDGGNIYIQLN